MSKKTCSPGSITRPAGRQIQRYEGDTETQRHRDTEIQRHRDIREMEHRAGGANAGAGDYSDDSKPIA